MEIVRARANARAKTSPASVSRRARPEKAPDVIAIDLTSPDVVRRASAAKTPASTARDVSSQPPSRGQTTRSASRSVSDSKKSEGRAAAAEARAAEVTPVPAPAATGVAGGAGEPFESAGMGGSKSFGKKLAAVANENETPSTKARTMRAEVPLFSENALFERSAPKHEPESRRLEPEPRREKEPEPEPEQEPAPEPEPEPEAPPPLPKLAPDLLTSFVPLAGYEENSSAAASGEKRVDGWLGTTRRAETAERLEELREEERRARGEAALAARRAASPAKPSVASSSSRPAFSAAPSVGAGGAAAGSVMERLQRAMESRSRLEAENRAKLETDQKRKEEDRRRREAEADARRRQKEADEAKDREEKKQRQEKMLKMRKEQEEAQREVEEKQARVRRLLEERDRQKAAGVAVGAKRKSGETSALDSAEEKKRRLQDFMANNRANAALAANAGAPGAPAVAAKLNAPTDAKPRVAIGEQREEKTLTPAAKTRPVLVGAPAEFSYQISPYRENSDSESEEDDAKPRKPIPEWAHADQLAPCLYRQAKVDPDAIFVNTSKTCSLDAVFADGKKKNRRSSSGNWFHDRLTWKEEVSYKNEMGFVTTLGTL